MNFKFFPLFILLLIPLLSFAQKDETIGERYQLKVTGAWGGWHLFAGEVVGDNTTFNGAHAALEFNKNIRLGWAVFRSSGNLNTDESQGYSLNYNGPTLEYAHMAHKAIHPTAGVAVGFGKYEIAGRPADKFVMIQPNIGCEFNILRWFRVSANAGYRLPVNSDYDLSNSLNSSGLFIGGKLAFGLSWGNNKDYKKINEN